MDLARHLRLDDDEERIELDAERAWPATLVVVPRSPEREPQVLSVPAERPQPVTRMVSIVGERWGRLD
jgi:hypothetical protein